MIRTVGPITSRVPLGSLLGSWGPQLATEQSVHCKCKWMRKEYSTVRLSHAEYVPREKFDDSKPPLMILHGLFGSKNNWQSLAKKLAHDLRTRIITVDARNHGNSPHHPVMDYMSMAEDVSDLITKLELPMLNLLGHSMGGRIAMALALTQPDLLRSLIIEDVTPISSPGGSQFPGYIAAMKALHLEGSNLGEMRRSAMLQLERDIPSMGVRTFLLQNLVLDDSGQIIWRANLDYILDNIHTISSWPEERLSGLQYDGPTHFIGGEKSEYLRSGAFTNKELIRSYFPHVTFRVIANAGHWVHSEQPKDFIKALCNFLHRLE